MEVKHCKNPDCNVELIVGENWSPSMEKNSMYKCKKCHSKTNKKWHSKNKERHIANIKKWNKNNPEKIKEHDNKSKLSLGIGVYVVELYGVPLYVGEGKIYQRKNQHLSCKTDTNDSQVFKYCKKHNIDRKLLSFNVLEYEDNKPRMLELEYYYRTILTPIINPLTFEEWLAK